MGRSRHAERVRFVACGASVALHILLTAGIANRTLEGVGGEGPRRAQLSRLSREPVMNLQFEPPDVAEKERPEPVPLVPPPPPVEELVLGAADGGDLPSKNWVGFAEATPHSAPMSTVNQPQLDLSAGGGDRPSEAIEAAEGDASAAPTSQPTPAPVPEPAAATPPQNQPANPSELMKPQEPLAPPVGGESKDPAQDEREKEPTQTPTAEEESISAERAEPLTRDGDLPPVGERDEPSEGTEPLERVKEVPRPPGELWDELDALYSLTSDPTVLADSAMAQTDAEREILTVPESPVLATPTPMPTSSPAASPPASSPKTAATIGDGPGQGEVSDKQTDASATEPSTEVRPGHPVAARGLEIVTRRPVFSKVTRVTSFPNNPEVEATFGRNGRVIRVHLRKTSGYTEVDQAVLDAVYSWTARGEALAKIPAWDPKAGVTLKFTILLK